MRFGSEVKLRTINYHNGTSGVATGLRTRSIFISGLISNSSSTCFTSSSSSSSSHFYFFEFKFEFESCENLSSFFAFRK